MQQMGIPSGSSYKLRQSRTKPCRPAKDSDRPWKRWIVHIDTTRSTYHTPPTPVMLLHSQLAHTPPLYQLGRLAGSGRNNFLLAEHRRHCGGHSLLHATFHDMISLQIHCAIDHHAFWHCQKRICLPCHSTPYSRVAAQRGGSPCFGRYTLRTSWRGPLLLL